MALEELDWTSIASFLCGGGGATFFARLFIKRAVDQLDDITRKLESCTQKLLILDNELRSLQSMKDLIVEHDRKLVELEVRAKKLRCQIRVVDN